MKVDVCEEVDLVGAALQGLLLDFRLWSDAGVEAQALLLEGISSVVSVEYDLVNVQVAQTICR